MNTNAKRIIYGKNVSEKQISELLLQLGFSCNNKGYFYIKHSLMLAITESDDYLYNVCKLLYYKIAKDFNTTAQSVERCIRHSISTVFTNYISASDIEKIFKNGYNSQKGVPTNSQFLMSLAEYIKYNY